MSENEPRFYPPKLWVIDGRVFEMHLVEIMRPSVSPYPSRPEVKPDYRIVFTEIEDVKDEE